MSCGQPADSAVTFVQTSDDGYVEQRPAEAPPFDLVLVNYAINADKARDLLSLLSADGRLLAPAWRDAMIADRSMNVTTWSRC